MNKNSKEFADILKQILLSETGKSEDYTRLEVYNSLVHLIKTYLGKNLAETYKTYKKKKVKQVYYLSMEFLTGTFLEKNLHYLGVFSEIKESLGNFNMNIEEIIEVEADPGLGNGGLGRLAAAFLDSLSTLSLPGHGHGIRYENGLFKQEIEQGKQKELPDAWIKDMSTWEYKRTDEAVKVRFGGTIDVYGNENDLNFNHRDYTLVKAVPYDTPIAGYQNDRVNTLRLWSAETVDEKVDFDEFSRGNYQEAFRNHSEISSIVQFLYPSDEFEEGKILRLKQEYFLVSASLQSIIANYKKLDIPIGKLHEYAAIHINDTHPVLAIPELMRLLMDENGLNWKEAWHITVNTVAYTNHTIMMEAMETWHIDIVRRLIPRIAMIIEEINHRYIAEQKSKNTAQKKIDSTCIIYNNVVRMVSLAIIGSHSINGVAKLHTDILKNRELKDYYDIFPNNFNNKTNGIVHRHWLLECNPKLTVFIENLIGDEFKTEPQALRDLLKYTRDQEVADQLFKIKYENKVKLADYIYNNLGIVVNPYSIFDVQIKRIHEYKRQLLNILHVMDLYNTLKENPHLDIVPRTFVFAGKSAPSYYNAKEIIRLIHSVAEVVNNDLTIKGKLKVVFLPNYNLSLAGLIIPAADVSEQISTTTKEASGTSNMKFMMNGAVTIATLDGANVEITKEVGENNIFLFGLKDNEVYDYYHSGNYRAYDIYQSDLNIQRVVDQLRGADYTFSGDSFISLYNRLIKDNDEFFVLKDFNDYKRAHERIGNIYRNKVQWEKISLTNIARSGVFSSDYTIKRYARDIWNIKPIDEVK